MAEKYQQQHEVQGYPLAPSTIVPRSDQESAHTNTYQSQQQQQLMKKKKRMKCLAYIALFAVFQTAIILVIALAIIRVRAPRVRLGDITITNNSNGNIRFAARVFIRNRNFGHYNFHISLATIRSSRSDGNIIGQFLIPDARVRIRSTRRIYVIADLNSLSSSSNNNSGVLSVIVNARLRGEVEFLRVIERRRSADLSCIMNIDLSNNSVRDLRCQ